jgi:hypothetical protein
MAIATRSPGLIPRCFCKRLASASAAKEPVESPSILAIDHELGRTMNPAGINYLCRF